MATSSTSASCRPSSTPASLNSAPMIGQSVVHTGSRKVISTTLPRRLASETGWPLWSVSWKPGAGRFIAALSPAMARARIGSAVRFAAAAAIGRGAEQDDGQRRHRPDRPDAGSRDRAAQRPRPQAAHALTPRVGLGSAGYQHCERLVRRRGEREVAGEEQQDPGNHAVRVGAEPAQEAEVLDQHPVRQAEHQAEPHRVPDQPGPPGQEHRAHRRERDHHHQVHREAVARGERAEPGHQGGQDVRLRGRGHLLDHAGQGAGLPVRRCPARTRGPARPAARPCR